MKSKQTKKFKIRKRKRKNNNKSKQKNNLSWMGKAFCTFQKIFDKFTELNEFPIIIK